MTLKENIFAKLRKDSNPDQAKIHQKYHKSDIIFYGWKTPDMRRLGNETLRAVPDRKTLLTLCEDLWKEPVFESRMIANFMLAQKVKWLMEMDFDQFHNWFKLADGWALTDMLAIPVFGEFLIRFPKFHKKVDDWKDDDWLWVRRAGILRFITPVRHKMNWPVELEPILIHHMPEKDFFIRKAIGWTLREWSKVEPMRVKAFSKKYRDALSPLSYREAVRNIK